MTFGPDKARDMARSILPSTWRGAGKFNAFAHRASRHRVREALAALARAPHEWEELVLDETDAREVKGVVSRRRSQDKVNPFTRWARHRTRFVPLADRLTTLASVLPKNLIGHHARSHLAHRPYFSPNAKRPRRRVSAWLDRGYVLQIMRRLVVTASGVAALHQVLDSRRYRLVGWSEADARLLNCSRRLLGLHDVAAFVTELNATRETRAVLDQFCRCLVGLHRFDPEAAALALPKVIDVPWADIVLKWAAESLARALALTHLEESPCAAKCSAVFVESQPGPGAGPTSSKRSPTCRKPNAVSAENKALLRREAAHLSRPFAEPIWAAQALTTMETRLVVVGGVAGGATAAARARRLNERAHITLVERGPYVSYANCGLPYFISGDIEKRSKLLLQTPEGFEARYRVNALVNTEALEIDRPGKRLRVRGPGGESWLEYDRLILAQGGSPIMPPLPGADAPHVFKLWTVPDMDRLHTFIEERKPKSAVVVGGGFIGLEMAEAFAQRGLATTVVELQPTVLSTMDREFGTLIRGELVGHGVSVVTGVGVKAVQPDQTVELSDGRRVAAELVLFSVGVRPELSLAKAAGLTLGPTGGLLVDEQLRTSDPSIFAAGDMIEVEQRVSGRRVRVPLAGPANRQGRIAATNALGGHLTYHGALGTSVVKVFEATAASTGLTENAARDAGFDVGVAVIHKDHHASYYPGGRELSLKLVYDRTNARILGAQAFGHAGVEKRIDVVATALLGRLSVHDLAELDLAYAPPYSSANDPLNLVAFIAENDLSGFSPLITAGQLKAELGGGTPPVVLDVRTAKEYAEGHLVDALHLPVDELRANLAKVPRNRRLVVHCRSGFRAHLALRILKENGFADVANVTGGWVSLATDGGLPVERGAHRSVA